MNATQFLPGPPPQPKFDVWYQGTDTIKNGYLLCANTDATASATTINQMAVAAIAATARYPERFTFAEKPAYGNAHRFLGVVTGLGDAGKTGPCAVTLARPCGLEAEIYCNCACTIDRTVLYLQNGSYMAGSTGLRRIGLAAQTVDRSLTNGLVSSALDTSVIDVPQQGLYTASDTQMHPIGMRYEDPFDGRVYRYSRAYAAIATELGAANALKSSTNAAVPAQAAAASAALIACGGIRQDIAAGAAGSDMITVTINNTFGAAGTGVLTANELAGGYAILGNGGSEHPTMRRIVSHAALAAAGSLTLRLDHPLVTAITTSENCEIDTNPWANLTNAGGSYATFMGVPTVGATAGQFVWIQTKGPCWITSNGATCDDADDRDIFFVGNGSVVSGTDATVESGYQRAGFAIDASSAGSSNGPLVYLQLD